MPPTLLSMLRRITGYDRNLIQFLSAMLEAEASTRKVVITIFRTRVFPEKSTRVFSRLRETLQRPIVYRNGNGVLVEHTLLDILRPIRNYITSPILAGFLMSIVQTLPLPGNQGYDLKQEAIQKEVLASTDRREPTVFNWSSVLSPNYKIRQSSQLADKYHIAPDVQHRIFHTLTYSKARLHMSLIFPQYSHKSMGQRSEEHLRRCWNEDDIQFENSTFGLEILYHRHGLQISGNTEMRVAFKYNDLRPRCYFAQGPNQYYTARYIQPIFNIILDAIPGVNRETRFDISGIRLTEDEVLFIYDYSSFTSNLIELTDFTRELANFYRGTKVVIVDMHYGLVETDLGDLLDDYNESCNNYPSFEIQRSLDPEFFAAELVYHHHSGMLGVPGNISSCTLLHGIHLMVLCLSMYCRCVGDDAIGAMMINGQDGKDSLYRNLSNLGDIAFSKMEFWESVPLELEDYDSVMWNYTKRPICRTGQRVYLDPMRIVFPSLGTIFPELADKDHNGGPRRDRKEVARILITFCRQFSTFDMIEVESFIVKRWLEEVLLRSGLKSVSESGTVVYAEGIVFPRSVEECKIEVLLERYACSREILTIPDLHCVEEEPVCHDWYVSKSKQALRYIVDLGYGVRKLKMRTGMARDLVEDLKTMFMERYSLFYDVVVFMSCPDFLRRLLETPSLPVDDDLYFFIADSDEEIDR